MAAVELTRMDFHVSRFMNSDDVDEMSAEDVGAFCLLLFKAWLVAKECTLPAEEERLAKYARVDKLSSLVLKQFPTVETEWGTRRRNGPQLEVWEAAKARSEAGKVGAEKRWGKQWEPEAEPTGDAVADAVAEPSHCGRNGTGPNLLLPTPHHTTSTRTNPNQTNPTQVSAGPGASGQEAKKTLGTWENLRRAHKHAFGKNPIDPNRHKTLYAEACHNYGEEIVLKCFGDWAESKREWVKADNVQRPLFIFWKALPDMAADAQNDQAEAREAKQHAAQAKQREEANAAAVEASIARQKAEDVAFMTKAPPPQNECHPFDIIPPADDDHSPYAEEWRTAQKGAE